MSVELRKCAVLVFPCFWSPLIFSLTPLCHSVITFILRCRSKQFTVFSNSASWMIFLKVNLIHFSLCVSPSSAPYSSLPTLPSSFSFYLWLSFPPCLLILVSNPIFLYPYLPPPLLLIHALMLVYPHLPPCPLLSSLVTFDIYPDVLSTYASLFSITIIVTIITIWFRTSVSIALIIDYSNCSLLFCTVSCRYLVFIFPAFVQRFPKRVFVVWNVVQSPFFSVWFWFLMVDATNQLLFKVDCFAWHSLFASFSWIAAKFYLRFFITSCREFPEFRCWWMPIPRLRSSFYFSVIDPVFIVLQGCFLGFSLPFTIWKSLKKMLIWNGRKT